MRQLRGVIEAASAGAVSLIVYPALFLEPLNRLAKSTLEMPQMRCGSNTVAIRKGVRFVWGSLLQSGSKMANHRVGRAALALRKTLHRSPIQRGTHSNA